MAKGEMYAAVSFAPPLTLDGLKKYRQLAAKAPPRIGQEMRELCELAQQYLQTPPAKTAKRKHPVGMGWQQKLDQDVVDQLDPHVPWPDEVRHLGEVFEAPPTGRDAAGKVVDEQGSRSSFKAAGPIARCFASPRRV